MSSVNEVNERRICQTDESGSYIPKLGRSLVVK